MARVKEPRHPLEKRELLHAPNPRVDRLDALAEQLIEDGRFGVSLDYLEVTRNEDLLGRLEKQAVKSGSAFLLQQVARLRKSTIEPTTWDRLIDNAKQAEHWRDAVRALTAAGREEEAEELRVVQCPEFEPFKPLGK